MEYWMETRIYNIQLNDDRLSDGHTGVYERSSMMQENNIRQTTKSTTLNMIGSSHSI